MISGKDPSPSFFSIINFFPPSLLIFSFPWLVFSLASLAQNFPRLQPAYHYKSWLCTATKLAHSSFFSLLSLLSSLSLFFLSPVKYSDCQTYAVNAHFFFFLTLEKFSCVLFFSLLSCYQLFHSSSLSLSFTFLHFSTYSKSSEGSRKDCNGKVFHSKQLHATNEYITV